MPIHAERFMPGSGAESVCHYTKQRNRFLLIQKCAYELRLKGTKQLLFFLFFHTDAEKQVHSAPSAQ